ncbi:MAG: CvpA family protein [Pseudomonadota bacterium]
MLNWTLFNWLDWVVVGVVLLSTVASLWRGFTREALSLAGWIAAFVIANLYAAQLSSLLVGQIDNVTARYVAAFVMLFVATLLVTGLLNYLARQVVRATGLGTLDRLLGTVFGMARGVIIILVLVYVARQLVPPEEQTWLYQSQLLPHLDMLAQWAQDVFSQLQDAERVVAIT